MLITICFYKLDFFNVFFSVIKLTKKISLRSQYIYLFKRNRFYLLCLAKR